MAINASIQSNLSIGPVVVSDPGPRGPTALQLYGTPSLPPIDAVALNLRKTTVIDQLSFPGERPKYYMKIDISAYHRFDGGGGNLFQISRLDAENSIYLPLPQALVDSNQVVYDQQQLGVGIGNLVEAGAQGANRAFGQGQRNQTMNSLQGALGTVGQAVNAATPNLAAAGATALAGAVEARTGIPVASLATLGSSLAGYTPNQFLTILMKGPAYKRHSFTWLVSPNNEREAYNLQQIILLINNAKAPGTMFGGALFTFPKVFTCSIMPNSQFMYKFKPAVVENFTVDFAGGGVPSFKRISASGFNAPSILQIRLDLLELEFWLTGNYHGDNDPLHTSSPLS